MVTDVLVIGGGPAGMSAALSASKNGSSVILVEREETLGGILKQCIHNGFGLHYFKEELTGPEFAHRFCNMVKKDKNIKVLTSTLVTNIEKEKVSVIGKKGAFDIKAKAVVLAMGCRERTAGNISLCGTRPSGILTAGTAQKMANIDGKLVGKNVVILGSGDIGLIMARRLTLEGAKVHAVLEINAHSSGLKRNILQCLDDFNIPLLFNTTIFEVVGKNRVEGIYYGQVDKNFNPIPETKKYLKCDTIILSCGLIPEMQLTPFVDMHKTTNGAIVNEYYQTSEKWLFSCGNILHVHDLVDNVAIEAEQAGLFASQYAKSKLKHSKVFKVNFSKEFSYMLPESVFKGKGNINLKFRLREKVVKQWLIVKCNDLVIHKQFIMAGTPGEMMSISFDKSKIDADINISLEGI